jgi:hypothetical protein
MSCQVDELAVDEFSPHLKKYAAMLTGIQSKTECFFQRDEQLVLVDVLQPGVSLIKRFFFFVTHAPDKKARAFVLAEVFFCS